MKDRLYEKGFFYTSFLTHNCATQFWQICSSLGTIDFHRDSKQEWKWEWFTGSECLDLKLFRAVQDSRIFYSVCEWRWFNTYTETVCNLCCPSVDEHVRLTETANYQLSCTLQYGLSFISLTFSPSRDIHHIIPCTHTVKIFIHCYGGWSRNWPTRLREVKGKWRDR